MAVDDELRDMLAAPRFVALGVQAPVQLWALASSHGCSGMGDSRWVAFDREVSWARVGELRSAVEVAEVAERPERVAEPLEREWKGTFGEFRVERDRVRAVNAQRSEAAARRRGAEVASLWASEGGCEVSFVVSPQMQGLELDECEERVSGVPVAHLVAEGCRCCGPSTWPAEWVEDDDGSLVSEWWSVAELVAAAGASAGPGGDARWWVMCAGRDGVDVGALEVLWPAAVAAFEGVVAAAVDAFEFRRWAVSLSPEEVDALPMDVFRRRQQALPWGSATVGWRSEASHSPVFAAGAVFDDAWVAFARVLAVHGFFLASRV